jgi:hypothetical protein
MTRKFIRTVRLQNWFPPRDSLAVSVARLCILREDFLLEFHGIYASEIGQLDEHSAEWRRIYFLRSAIRTLREMKHVIDRLQVHPEFKKALASRSSKERREFRELVRQLNAEHQLVKQLRDALGGHVLESAVQKALDGMHPERLGFFEVGRILKSTHYKFAVELVAEMLVSGVPENQRIARLEDIFTRLGALLPIIAIADQIVLTYLESRGLI